MRFSKSIVDIIRKRTSRRTYIPELLADDVEKRLLELLKLENITSPFSDKAGKSRFELVNVPEFDPKEKKKLGTYGLILGAQQFIVGAIEESKYEREHFGYVMEYIILGATDMGLGTCWLGGFFNRSLFSSKIDIKENEIVPAITPIGLFPEKRRAKEKVVRLAIRADKRRPWDRLVFEGDFTKPLDKNTLNNYATLIEMVRLGPSAGNKQPWRIVKESGKNIYHFYIVEVTGRYKVFPPIDIGIAVCHWDLTAEELEIKGSWVFSEPKIQSEGYVYKITWIGN